MRHIIRACILISTVRHQPQARRDADIRRVRAVALHDKPETPQDMAEAAVPAGRHRDRDAGRPPGQPAVGVRLRVGAGPQDRPGALRAPLYTPEIGSSVRVPNIADIRRDRPLSY